MPPAAPCPSSPPIPWRQGAEHTSTPRCRACIFVRGESGSRMSGNLFDELKRRKVFKVGAAYLVVAWLAVQAASIGFPAFDLSPRMLRLCILFAALGLPLALALAWV